MEWVAWLTRLAWVWSGPVESKRNGLPPNTLFPDQFSIPVQ
jgi:hypothetical protein